MKEWKSCEEERTDVERMKKKKTGNSQEDLCQPTLVSEINQRTEYPSMQQCKINNTVHYCLFNIYLQSSVCKQKIDQALLNMLDQSFSSISHSRREQLHRVCYCS